MIYRVAILCLSMLMMLSGTANAAQNRCASVQAQKIPQMSTDMHADCDMALETQKDHTPADNMGETGDTACCCPVILGALSGPAGPDSPAAPLPVLFDAPLDTSLTSLSSVPEPPPPRA